MRDLLALVIASAGCGFHTNPSEGDDQPKPPDAPAQMVDAPVVDAMVDAAIDGTPPCQDDDGDSVCNAADTWPCGPAPTMPGDPVTTDATSGSNHLTMTLTGATVGSGSKLRVVAPGGNVTLTSAYGIVDCICTGCIDQIQVGFVPGTTKRCIYDGNPACPGTTSGNGSVTLTAPSTPGVYDIRFRIGQDYSCFGNSGTNTAWWDNAPPPANATVARICVH